MSKPEQKLVRFDWAMKSLLRDKANFDVLEGFLTALLGEEITVKGFIGSGRKNIIECRTSKNTTRVVSVDVIYDLHETEGEDYLYHGKTRLFGRHTDKEAFFGDYFIFPESYYIYVKNFDNEVRDLIDEWVYLFKNEQVKEDFRSPGIESAEKKLDYLSMSHEERQRYDDYLFNASGTASAFATARVDGRVEELA